MRKIVKHCPSDRIIGNVCNFPAWGFKLHCFHLCCHPVLHFKAPYSSYSAHFWSSVVSLVLLLMILQQIHFMILQNRIIRYCWYIEAASRAGFNVSANLLWQKARKTGRKQAHDLQAIAVSSLGGLLSHNSEKLTIDSAILSLRKNDIFNLWNCFTCNKKYVTLLNIIISQIKILIYKADTIYTPMFSHAVILVPEVQEVLGTSDKNVCYFFL